MASIRKRTGRDGKSAYFVEVRLKGCPSQRATFERLTDARNWVQQTESAIREGRYFKTVEARRHTLADAIDRYRESVLPTKRDQRKQSAQLNWWRKHYGSYVLADVTPALLGEARDTLTTGRAPGTVVRYLAAISHVFTTAVREWGWIDDNPVRKVRKPKEPRGRARFLSDNERDSLLKACEDSGDPHLHLIVVLALSTGMRQGEIVGLRWSDIDIERGRIVLHETKNGETRVVPLVGRARDLMREHAKVRRMDSDLVFPGRRKGRPAFVRTRWNRVCQAAGLKDFRFHDLRHSAASYMLMSGASLGEIAELLGHKTLQMVKRYSHLSEPHSASVVERMNNRFLA